jgi:hypothetical protein
MRNPEQKFEALVPPSESGDMPEKPEEKEKAPRSPEDPYITIGENSVSFLGVEVPKGPGGELVPLREEAKKSYYTYLAGHYRLMREMAISLLLNKPIIHEGGTGVYNKTTTAELVCHYLGLNYYKIDMGLDLDKYDVIGDKEPEKDDQGRETIVWYDGPLLRCIRNGGVAYLDEYNRQSRLSPVINPIIDAILNGKKTFINPLYKKDVVRVHPYFRLMASQNPPGFEGGHTSVGRQPLPSETFGRWIFQKTPIQYTEKERNQRLAGMIGEDVEIEITPEDFRGKVPTKEELAERVRAYQEGRRQRSSEFIPGEVSTLVHIPGMVHWRAAMVDIFQTIEAKSRGAKREWAKGQQQPLSINPRLENTILEYIAIFYNGDINETVKNAFETCVVGMYGSETDKQKIRLLLDQASWKPQAAESKRKGPKREAKKQPKEKEKEKAETKEPMPETKLEGTIAEQIETAIEKLGKENVFGPKEVEKTFGVRLREVPGIPFSVEELERAEKMGQMLVLRVDKTEDGKPMSLSAMNGILATRWEKEKKGGLLNTVDGWRDAVTGEKDFAEVAPRSGWALVSKDLLMHSAEDEKKYGKEEAKRLFDSTSKNYIEQTEVIINTLRESEKAFKDIEVPEEYEEAIREFEANKDRLTKLMSENWEQAAKELSELKINQLTRQSIQEAIYDLAMYYDTRGKRLLPDKYAWSNSRFRLGGLVGLGDFGALGVRGHGWEPGRRDGAVGVSLSRRL